MTKAAVIGWPIEQSLSPVIHGYWLKKLGLEGSYGRVGIKPESLENDIQTMIADGYAGFNITMPHKQAIMPLLYEVDDLATRIGAVNTVTIRDGRLHGTNTDAYGFLAHLQESAGSRWKADKPALVIGAGGAARAATVALLDAGVPEIRLTNRTMAKAEEIAAFLADDRVRVIPWEDRHAAVSGAGLVTNTTSLGMLDSPALDLSLDAAGADCVVYDIVYKPLMTPLLTVASEKGLVTVNGLGMLMHQAVPGFRYWFGGEGQVDAGLKAAVEEFTGC